jgi:FAD synthetase
MENKRIVITGTFDLLHPGHVHLITEAAKLGKVIVIVARDKNVSKVKGHPPVVSEEQRLFMVKALKGVDEAVLGYEGSDYLRIIKEQQPDVLLLGPNQEVDPDAIQKELQNRGLTIQVIRLPKLFDKFPLSSTSKIIKTIGSREKQT